MAIYKEHMWNKVKVWQVKKGQVKKDQVKKGQVRSAWGIVHPACYNFNGNAR